MASPLWLAPLLIGPALVVAEGFEAGDEGWSVFEEIVGGSPCYGEGLARVEASREAARVGDAGFVVEANAAGSRLSNHVIAGRRLPAVEGGVVTYAVQTRVPVSSAGVLEAGPELSVQLTRPVGSEGHETVIAGVQLVANPWVAPSWNVWREVAPGVAAWRPVHEAALEPGAWYTMVLVADLDALRYVSLTIAGEGVSETLDLSQVSIARERRFDEAALWITLEAENLWTNCGSTPPTTAAVHYDEVAFSVARSG